MPVDEKKASIQDYEVNPRYIGKGGFATVYRATHKDTGIEYAVKIINKKSLAGKENLLRRINAEVKIHYQLKHRSICELYEVFEDENSIYLVLRLCENGEFMTYLKKRGKLDENDTRCYMHQIVEGVVYLHRHKIMHRDLTLSNLLLTKEGTVMIADFGLATQVTDSNPCHTTFCGTPNYLSPEVASGLPHGLSTDVWSLGVMMYTMLTGYPPFAQNSGPNETIEKVREGKWKMPEGISYFAQDLLNKLLQKDPRQRISLEQVRLHPFMMNNDAANYISAGGASGTGSFSRQTSIPQVAAGAASGAIHHLSASSGSHTPRMPVIQASASTPYTPNLSTSSSSLKMTATTASGSFNDEGNDSGLANSTASTSVSHHHTRSMTSGGNNTNLATLNSGLENQANFYHQQNQYSSSGSSNTSSHEHHHHHQHPHHHHQQQQHHNVYNNSNGNNLPLSSASSSSFRHTQQQAHHYPSHPSSQPFEHLKSGSSSSSDNNNLSSSLSSPHSSSSAAPSPPLSAFTDLAIQPNQAQLTQNPHQIYQQHSQHSYTNQYPTNASNNISYDNNTSSSSNRQHSQTDRVKQRPGPGSLVDQSPPVKLGPYPTRDNSLNNRDNSTTPYTTQPQYQHQQQQQQQQLQMRSSSSLSQTNPMYSYNQQQQQQEFVAPPPQPSQMSSSRGHLTSSMSMDDLTANSRLNGVASMTSFSPCPSPMPTSYAMQRSDSTSHLSSMSGVTHHHQQPPPQPNHDQSASKRPPRYQYSATPLKFTRQVLKNTYCYTAISNVECQIEVLKESKSKNKMTIREILRIKFDDDRINVFKCKSPLPFSVNEMPPCPEHAPCYTLDSLPSEYWAKYTNACRYMMLIRNKTPKVTVYLDQVKAVLFDAPGFFEARFTNCRINFGTSFVHIVKASGEEFKLTGVNSVNIPEDTKPLLDQADDMYKLCQSLEKASEIGRTKMKVFPIVVGEKPRKQQTQTQPQPPPNPAQFTVPGLKPSQPISSSHPNLSQQQQQLQKHQPPQNQQFINHQEYHHMATATIMSGNELRSASTHSVASSTLSSSVAAPYKPNTQHQQYIVNHQPNNHIYPPQQQQQQQLFSSNQQLYQQQYQQQNRSASYQRHNHLSNC